MPPRPIDFVIVTPLAEERDAILARLPGYRKLPPAEDDIRVYYAADIPVRFPDGTEARYAITVVPLAKMGHTEAASAAGDAIRRWRPRYVVLVGIAGGLAQAGVSFVNPYSKVSIRFAFCTDRDASPAKMSRTLRLLPT